MRHWLHRKEGEFEVEHRIACRVRYRLKKFGLKMRRSRVDGGYIIFDPKGTFAWGLQQHIPLPVVDEFSEYLMLRERLPGDIAMLLTQAVYQNELKKLAIQAMGQAALRKLEREGNAAP